LGSRVIRYVRDGRTKPTFNAPFPTGGGIITRHYDNNAELKSVRSQA